MLDSLGTLTYTLKKTARGSMMTACKITASLEDYLESIYNHIQAKQGVKAVDISRDLGVSRSSVTETLHKLAERGLVNYSHYGVISLTDEGLEIAKEVLQKHLILSEFFENILGVDAVEAQENACRIEHVISEDAFARLIAFTEFSQQHGLDFQKFYQEKK